jgi:transketolase
MEDTVELIEIDTAETQEELCEKEIQYIQEYNSYYLNKNGYNMTYGGETFNGYVYTEEDNRKNSERMKKHYEDNPEARQKCSERVKKYNEKNPEAAKEHSQTRKNYYKKKPKAGKEHGERVKEYYEKNPEAREQASERTKKRFESPEARKDHSEALKKHYENNPEARKKILDTKGQNKPFDVYTIDGTFVKTFKYQFEARDYLQKEYHITTIIDIIAVLSGQLKRSAGFVFKYK